MTDLFKMKMYDKYFMKRFRRNLGILESEFRNVLHRTEQEQNRSFPESFDYDLLVWIVCNEYGISQAEFESDFKYGSLGRARQTVCFILSVLGAKNKRISNITGFPPSTVSNSVRAISENYDALLVVERILEKLNVDG